MNFKKLILDFLYWIFVGVLLIIYCIFGIILNIFHPTFWSDLFYFIEKILF